MWVFAQIFPKAGQLLAIEKICDYVKMTSGLTLLYILF